MNNNGNNIRKKAIPVKLIITILVVVAIIVTLFTLPVREYMQKGLEWTEDLGIWGPVFVAFFYIIACVLFLPGSILTLGAGALFGLVTGTITVSIGSILGGMPWVFVLVFLGGALFTDRAPVFLSSILLFLFICVVSLIVTFYNRDKILGKTSKK